MDNNSVLEKVLSAVQKANILRPNQRIENSMPFSEQGIDSLDLSNVLLNIEESLNIEIPDEDINQIMSVDSLVNYLLENHS